MSAPKLPPRLVFIATFGDVTITSTDGKTFVASRSSAPGVTGVGVTAEVALVDLLKREAIRRVS